MHVAFLMPSHLLAQKNSEGKYFRTDVTVLPSFYPRLV